MFVKLSREQERALLAFVQRHTADEVAAGCEPSGYTLEIGVCPPWSCNARVQCGSAVLELGEVEVRMSADDGNGG